MNRLPWYYQDSNLNATYNCIHNQMKMRVMSGTWWHERSPLISPLEGTTSWTTVIQQNIPYATHKQIWKICILRHTKMGKSGWKGRREERSAESWGHQCNLKLTSPGRGKDWDYRYTLCGSEQFCLSDQHTHIIQPNPTIGAKISRQKSNTEVLQLWSNSLHCRTENKATEPGNFPTPSQF